METHQQCFEYVHARHQTHDIPTCSTTLCAGSSAVTQDMILNPTTMRDAEIAAG